jgi:hypothetical protein
MEIEPFATDMLDSVVALALRAWEPVFRSIAEAKDPEVFRHFYPDWRVDQAKAVEAACLPTACEYGSRAWKRARLVSSP